MYRSPDTTIHPSLRPGYGKSEINFASSLSFVGMSATEFNTSTNVAAFKQTVAGPLSDVTSDDINSVVASDTSRRRFRSRSLQSTSTSAIDVSFAVSVTYYGDSSSASDLFSSVSSDLTTAVESGSLSSAFANSSAFSNLTMNNTAYSTPATYDIVNLYPTSAPTMTRSPTTPTSEPTSSPRPTTLIPTPAPTREPTEPPTCDDDEDCDSGSSSDSLSMLMIIVICLGAGAVFVPVVIATVWFMNQKKGPQPQTLLLRNNATTNRPNQIQGRVQVTVRLGQPLGVEVNPDLTVKNLNMGGQLQRLGTVKPGDRILSMGGTTLSTTDQFLSIIRERTNQGQQELDMIFEQVSFHFRLPRL